MKKLLIFTLAIGLILSASCGYSACRIGVNITPDPSGAADDQELWLNPDGVASNGDEVLGATLAGNAVTGSFVSATDCTAMPDMTVYIKSHFPGGIELVSAEVVPQDIVSSVLSIAIKHQE